jgi:lipopolysaccharide transport system ATP-binding protein
VRLAFAVAAHLDVDILIVDEVLAVGDAEFQKKCLGKMNDARRNGRTVLLVSHNIAVIRELCTKVLWLDSGRIERFGEVGDCTARYLAHAPDRKAIQATRRLGASLELRRLDVDPNPLAAGSQARVQIEIAAMQATRIDELSIAMNSSSNVRIAVVDLRSFGFPLYLESGQTIVIAFSLSALNVLDDEYPIGLFVRTSEIVANVPDLIRLRIVPGSDSTNPVHYPAGDRGFLALSLSETSMARTPA